MKFDPDSVPFNISSLRAEIYNPIEVISLWNHNEAGCRSKRWKQCCPLSLLIPTGVSRIYLYNSKIHYATLAGNLAEWIAYFPLFMGLCMSTDVFKCKELVI